MPTISDLKDQARALEQQGDVERALTIYQHILKHLEGTPAITKVLPLYVKAGDLLHKMDRPVEAVTSYEAAAQQYAITGAAPRVVALCTKIIRLAPEKTHVYIDFGRSLIEHGHVGSARDVLAEYAALACMDKALETLNDLAGRPNDEVLPLLERLLSSFEDDDPSEQAAERVSIQLEQVTDDLAGELSGIPDEPEAPEAAREPEGALPAEREEDEAEELEEGQADPAAEIEESREEEEPLAPQLLDLDHMPQRSSLEMKRPDFAEDEDDETGREKSESPDAPDSQDDAPIIEHAPEADITTDVTPTMEGLRPDFGAVTDTSVDVYSEGAEVAEKREGRETGEETEQMAPAVADTSDKLELLVADSFSTEDDVGDDDLEAEDAEKPVLDDPAEAIDSSDGSDVSAREALEIETSVWQPDFPEPSAEDTVAAEWAPEEQLKPAARYPSDEYDAPELDAEADVQEDQSMAEFQDSAAIDEEISRAVEDSAKFAAVPMPAEQPSRSAGPGDTPIGEPPSQPSVEAPRRQTPRTPVMIPHAGDGSQKPPIVFGVGGFVLGLLAGAGLTLIFAGGDSGESPEASQLAPREAVETPATVAETPAAPALDADDLPQATSQPVAEETTAVDEATEPIPDTSGAALPVEAAQRAPEEESPDTSVSDAMTDQAEGSLAATGNPIIIDGMAIEEIEEIEYRGLAGFRVVHMLDWADPIVIEAYRDTSVSLSTFIQVNVTPPDTVVGIRRLDGYMVYASGVMQEDSLRALMSRLVEGERPTN